MPRVFSYERVSSALQAEQGRGLERQPTATDSWCAARGLQIDDGLSDAGISAFKGDNVAKGALGKFLAMAQAGNLGNDPILLVEAIDRLSRQEALDSLPDVFSSAWSAPASPSSASKTGRNSHALQLEKTAPSS